MKTSCSLTILNLLCISVLLLSQAQGQNIGINGTGANAHPSALLDVDDAGTNTKGLLIPRLALTAINVSTPVTAPATSLLVYNTATASTGTNAVSPGYYYWDAVKWVRFAYTASGSSAEAWAVLGNGGTNPATNFLGTTDNQDLVFRTNNTEKMRLMTNGVLRNTIPSNIIGVGGQGENTNSIIWGINTGGFAVGIYNASLASQSNGLVVKTASNSYSNTILDLTTGIDNVIGASVMNVRADGKVGVGTASPLEKLHVFGGNVAIADNAQANYNISRTAQLLYTDNIRPWSDNGFRIYDGNTNGYLDINNASDTYIQSHSTLGVAPNVLNESGGATDLTYSHIALNPYGGNVGVGTAAPSAKLDVIGRVQASNVIDNVFGTLQGANYQDLIGTYAGWDPTAVYIAGYNAFSSSGGRTTTKIYFGGNAPTSNLKMMIDLNSGNVGINSLAPTEKLEVQGSVKIVDGTQGAGRVLTSDANGKATWGTLGPQTVVGVVPFADLVQTQILNSYQYMGYSIVVPAGRSTVSAGIFTQTSDNTMNYFTCQLSASASVVGDLTGFSNLPGLCAVTANHQATAVGTVVFYVNNTSGSPKTLYVWGYAAAFTTGGTITLRGNSTAAEPYIIAAY